MAIYQEVAPDAEAAAPATAEAWRARGEEMARRMRLSRREGPREPTYRYLLEFDCVPSVFDRIKGYVCEQATGNRSYRYYPTKGGDGDG